MPGQCQLPPRRADPGPAVGTRPRAVGAVFRPADLRLRRAAAVALHPPRALFLSLRRTRPDLSRDAAVDPAPRDGNRRGGALPGGAAHAGDALPATAERRMSIELQFII